MKPGGKVVMIAAASAISPASLMPGFISPGYRGDALLFRATQAADMLSTELWRPYISGVVHLYDIDSTHEGLHLPEPLSEICTIISRVLAESK